MFVIMPILHLITFIQAPVERVFDLSRDISFHAVSMQHTNEKAVAGKTSGLIQEGETVTWQAKHLLKTRLLTTKITLMKPYSLFVDEMIEGDFRSMKHEHHFEYKDGVTLMKDIFCFESPYGILGQLANSIFLTNYMRRLLILRNNLIKEYAERGFC